MHPVELSQVTAVLETLAPRICLEWGSGGSTRELLASFPFIERYVSVEHHKEWADRVRELVTDTRLELHHVAPNRPLEAAKPSRKEIIAWDARAEHEPEVLRNYVEFPASLGVQFDFVLVDGRARRFCLEAGFRLLRPGGVIVLHDAQRVEYHDAVHALGRGVFLEPWHQGQVCLVRKGDELRA